LHGSTLKKVEVRQQPQIFIPEMIDFVVFELLAFESSGGRENNKSDIIPIPMKANQPCSLGQLKPTGAAVFNLGTPGYQGLGRGAPGMGGWG